MGDWGERAGLTTLEFVRRVFGEVEESVWLLHVATGQVLWANRRAASRYTSADGAEGILDDVHARLLAAHTTAFDLRTQPLNVEGYALALYVAALCSEAASSHRGEDTTAEDRTSHAWWVSERKLTPTLAAVAVLLVRGATPETIARQLDVTLASAKTYIKRVRRRLPEAERCWIARRVETDRADSEG